MAALALDGAVFAAPVSKWATREIQAGKINRSSPIVFRIRVVRSAGKIVMSKSVPHIIVTRLYYRTRLNSFSRLQQENERLKESRRPLVR